jgi:Helix-turn-helix domain
MSARQASTRAFASYSAEHILQPAALGDVAYCARCKKLGRQTPLVQKSDAIGRVRDRCPRCDGVSKPQPRHPDEVLRPQALISPAELLPSCPAGKLRCQACAHAVEGDARLCARCELPGLDATSWDSGLIPVGAVITAARTAAGLSLAEVARRVGTSPTAVRRLEATEYEGHTTSSLRHIAAAVGCTMVVRFARFAPEAGK